MKSSFIPLCETMKEDYGLVPFMVEQIIFRLLESVSLTIHVMTKETASAETLYRAFVKTTMVTFG